MNKPENWSRMGRGARLKWRLTQAEQEVVRLKDQIYRERRAQAAYVAEARMVANTARRLAGLQDLEEWCDDRMPQAEAKKFFGERLKNV